MKNVRPILFGLILLCAAQDSSAAIKVLTPAGQAKLNKWAQKVARIYATALKHVSGVPSSGEMNVYVYAYHPGGFTTAGYAVVNFSSNNMPASAGCAVALSTPTAGSLNWGCPGSRATVTSVSDYGAYNAAGGNVIMFQPYAPQMCLALNYGFGTCLGTNVVTSIRSSCVIGARKVTYNMNPVAYCGITSIMGGWVEMSLTQLSEDVCLASTWLKTPYMPSGPPPCSSKDSMAEIRAALSAYKNSQASCNAGLVDSEANYDIEEINATLGEMQNGLPLGIGDVQGDTDPAPAHNPWTTPRPELAVNGQASRTYLAGSPLPESLKVKVANPDGTAAGNVPVVFSVTAAPAADWSFLPGQTGQPVTLAAVNGTAEAGFRLGSSPGNYSIKATCADCCPGEAAFTVQALSENQATELRPYPAGNCDFNSFVGYKLSNGVRVRAVNKFTGQGVPNRQVGFTLVSHPGGTGMSLTPASSDTVPTNDPNGVARAQLMLGSLPGNHRISAVCQSCEGNQEVICNVNALPLPEVCSDVPEIAPIPLKKSPIKVALQDYIIAPGGSTHVDVYIHGQARLGLVASVEPVPNSGGHQHTNPVRPHGTISPQMSPLDANGYAGFTYTAGEVGGQERIIIRAPELPDYGDAVVLVSVPGLGRLGPSPDYFLSGETPHHPSNHYGSELLRQEIPNIARAYTNTRAYGGGHLRVNDISLINGGLFDLCGTWNTAGCSDKPTGGHVSHRGGKNADFGYYHISRLGETIRVPDMSNRLTDLLTAHTEINCKTTYEGSHVECPRGN